MKIPKISIGINQQAEYFADIFASRLVPLPQSTSFDAARCALSEYVKNIPISKRKVALMLQKP